MAISATPVTPRPGPADDGRPVQASRPRLRDALQHRLERDGWSRVGLNRSTASKLRSPRSCSEPWQAVSTAGEHSRYGARNGSEKMERVARCSCGQISVQCHGEPLSVSACHCSECKKRTGSPFGVAAFFLKENVKIEGDSKVYERTGDSGFVIAHHFCEICGSTVFWYPRRAPDRIAVALGNFADRDFPAPAKEVYSEHRHEWAIITFE